MGRSDLQGSAWHYEYHSAKQERKQNGSEWSCKWYFDGECSFKAARCTGGENCKWFEHKPSSNAKGNTNGRKKKKVKYRRY